VGNQRSQSKRAGRLASVDGRHYIARDGNEALSRRAESAATLRRRPAVRRQNETVMWTTSCGLTCFVSRYDENRFQLRLARNDGTVKADLFGTWAATKAASHRWRFEVRQYRPDDWLRQLDRGGRATNTRSLRQGR